MFLRPSFFLCFFVSFLSSLCAQNEAQMIADLTQFSDLAQRCEASLRTTRNKNAYEQFAAIKKIYRQHHEQLESWEELDSKALSTLHETCTNALQALLPVRSAALVKRDAQHAPEQTSVPSLVMPFTIALEAFSKEYTDDLLAETTTQRSATRFVLQLCTETIAAFGEKMLSKSLTKKKFERYPTLRQRLTSLPQGETEWKYCGGKTAIASARVGAHFLINEYFAQGINSYKQKLLELVGPVLIAYTILAFSGYGGMKDLEKGFTKAVLRFVMTRALLSQTHKLYKAVNVCAYVAPFVSHSLFKYGPGENLMPNMLIDGLSAFVLFELIPNGVDAVIPRTMPLNPQHRRKAIKTLPREWVAQLNEAVTSAAFARA